VSSAKEVAERAAEHLPAFCELTAVISPVRGSRIGVVYRLPEGWNGKMLGLGGGGWAGDTKIRTAAEGLARGYATAQTDAGHASTTVWDTSWARNPESRKDFSYRAVHLMTLVGKEVIASHYGRRETRAYFQGCSTGGRQALMEVQRFPQDYDGVTAGAPVYGLLTQSSGLLRNRTFTAPGAALSPAQLERLNAAALAACDAADGVKDGIVTDPRRCGFDPGVLECRAATASADCLTKAQVAAVRRVYGGVRTSDGQIAAYPLARGSEAGWSRFLSVSAAQRRPGASDSGGGMSGLREALFGDAGFDLLRFDPDRDLKRMRTSAFARMYEARDADLSAFVARGGKLILWHGFYDPGPSPLGTIGYYERVLRTSGAKTRTVADSVRLFILPGVYHCRGGPGADRFDALSAIEEWVGHDRPPAHLVATRNDGKLSRPLCAYPQLPHYRGSGDPNEAASFECR